MEDGVGFKPNPQDRKKVSRYVRLNNRISVVNTINLAKAFIVILCFVLFDRRRNYYRDRHEDFEAKKYAPALIRQGDNKKTSPLKLEGESPLSIEKNLLKSSNVNPTVEIPDNINSAFAAVSEKRLDSDVPVFWHILKSGGTSIKDIYGTCMSKVEASETGILKGHDADKALDVIQVSDGGIHYVNVDTTTPAGLVRAKEFKLIESGRADIVFTPLIHEASELFSPDHRAQCFAIFRHPVERAISLFHYLKKAHWEPTFSKKLEKINTLEDYAVSEFAEDNWMVRFLTNKMTEKVTHKELAIAKEIIKQKCLVGLLNDMEESVKRFNKYFGFSTKNDKCIENLLKLGGSNKNIHKGEEEGGGGWRILRSNNLLDLELYDYVLQLYEEQKDLVK